MQNDTYIQSKVLILVYIAFCAIFWMNDWNQCNSYFWLWYFIHSPSTKNNYFFWIWCVNKRHLFVYKMKGRLIDRMLHRKLQPSAIFRAMRGSPEGKSLVLLKRSSYQSNFLYLHMNWTAVQKGLTTWIGTNGNLMEQCLENMAGGIQLPTQLQIKHNKRNTGELTSVLMLTAQVIF